VLEAAFGGDDFHLASELGVSGAVTFAGSVSLAALVACHAAVRFGDRLDLVPQQRLLDQLVATPGGTTCPHGRPSVLILDDAMLRRAFRRPAR